MHDLTDHLDPYDELDEFDPYDTTESQWRADAEDFDFWSHEMASPLGRIGEITNRIPRTRDASPSHGTTRPAARPVTRPTRRPAPRSAGRPPHRPTARRSAPNPLMPRMAALGVIFALGIPVAMAMRPDDPTAGAIAPITTTLAIGTAPTTAAAANTPILLNPNGGGASSAMAPAAVATGSSQPTPATVAAMATRPACVREHEIVAGDYWLRIADRYDVSLESLLTANNAGLDYLLLPGETVCLPKDASTPTSAAPTTTKAPSTTKPPSTTLPPSSYTVEQVKQIIRDVWPDDLEQRALEIAYRESRYNPLAKNWCCYGVFQIYWDVHKSWLPQIGITTANQLYDPYLNSLAAYWVYKRAGGWGPWGF